MSPLQQVKKVFKYYPFALCPLTSFIYHYFHKFSFNLNCSSFPIQNVVTIYSLLNSLTNRLDNLQKDELTFLAIYHRGYLEVAFAIFSPIEAFF